MKSLFFELFKGFLFASAICLMLSGCAAKDVKQLGGNMMTTNGGGPGVLVLVGIGGLMYAAGSAAEDE